MDVVVADVDLQPELRDALDRAAAGAETVRVLSVQGGYRLVIQDKASVGDWRPRGPARLGTMQVLGRELPDLD